MKRILFSLALIACFRTSGSYEKIEGVDHRNKLVSLDTSNKKGTVLVFLSSKCPCSDSHIEEVKRLKSKYKNFQFVGIHSNYTETKEEALEYFDRKKVNFPVIHDSSSSLAKELGAVKTPHAYVLNSQGEIVYMGGVTNRSNALKASKFYLDETLLEMKAGKKPNVSERKTLGCYIALKD